MILCILGYTVDQQVLLVTAAIVYLWMVILLNEVLEPVTICTTVVFLGDEGGKLADLLVKKDTLGFRYKGNTGLVALTLCTPVVRVNGEFAGCLDVGLAIAYSGNRLIIHYEKNLMCASSKHLFMAQST